MLSIKFVKRLKLIMNDHFDVLKDIRLSDIPSLDDDEGIAATKSVYSGADVKLDAFDCFHKSLNQSVSGYIFSISDAAIVLKQFSPDIIKKIVPLIMKQRLGSFTLKKQTDKTEYFDGALDQEVSQITIQKKNSDQVKLTKNTIKRPDASRPTRMLSVGSNSCSPVSAAVHALISISAPATDGISTETNSYNKNPQDHASFIEQQRVFKPLSKPTEALSSESVQVFKPIAGNKEKIFITTNDTKDEISEVLVSSKSDPFIFVTTSTNETSHQPKMSTMVNSSTNPISFTDMLQSKSFSDSKDLEQANNSQNNFSHYDALPNFNLLLSTSGVDLQCGLPSPFQQQFPTSPLTCSTSQEAVSTACQNFTHSSMLHSSTMSQLFSSLANSSSLEQHSYIEQSQGFINNDPMLMSIRMQNPLRNILPKPEVASTLAMPINTSAVISSSVSLAQLSPLIKLDEKKMLRYSVPPNHIFPVKVGSNSIQFSTSSSKSNPGNQNYFFPSNLTSMDALMFTKRKTKKVKIKTEAEKIENRSHMSPELLALPRVFKRQSFETENAGGSLPLEVASALLSMGTESSAENEDNLQNIVESSLKKQNLNVVVTFSESGMIKIDDVEIDPKKHDLKKGTCFYFIND